MLERQAGARQDQARQPVRNGDGETGADADPCPRRNPSSLGGVEVQTGVVVVRPGRQRRLVAELDEPDLLHAGKRRVGRGRHPGGRDAGQVVAVSRRLRELRFETGFLAR